MRRTPTPEQQAQAAERRAKLRALAHQIGAMSDEERATVAARIGVVTIEGRRLSLHNQLMIAMQAPTASVVGGFKQWRKAGRAVVKGEHGIGIWIPRFGEGEDGTAAPAPECFLFGFVFDISQTAPAGAEVEA